MRRTARVIRLTVCGLALLGLSRAPAWAQLTPAHPSGRDGAGVVRELAIRPARAPERSLAYSLLPIPGADAPPDAAPLYHQAMLVVAALPGEDQRALEQISRAAPVDMDVALGERIVTRLHDAFALVELAAHAPSCEWGTQLQKRGLGVLIPEAPHLHLLGAALAAKARLEILRGRREDAVRTIGLGMQLARHVARGPTILQGLIALAIADRMADQVEAFVSARDAPEPPGLYWALVELGDHPVDMLQGMRLERFILGYEVPGLDDIEAGRTAPDAALAAMRRFLYPERGNGKTPPGEGIRAAARAAARYPAARRWMLSRGLSIAEVDRLPVTYVSMRYELAGYLTLRDELCRWFPLPYWQGRPGLLAAQQKVEDARAAGGEAPLLQMIPNLAAFARNAAQVERRFAMLRTVEAIRAYAGAHGGAPPASLDALGATPVPLDPVTGRAFVYRLEGETCTLLGPAPEPVAGAPERMEYRLRIDGTKAK